MSLPETGLASSVEDPSRLAEVREAVNQLRREIGELPRQQFEVFCLSDLDGRSNRQIAESLGIREGAVATALHKARRQLTASMTRLSRREEI